jgi:hypothetical protein
MQLQLIEAGLFPKAERLQLMALILQRDLFLEREQLSRHGLEKQQDADP